MNVLILSSLAKLLICMNEENLDRRCNKLLIIILSMEISISVHTCHIFTVDVVGVSVAIDSKSSKCDKSTDQHTNQVSC